MEAANTKYGVAQQNCQNIYDNDNVSCRRDYDVAMFEANKKVEAAYFKCLMTPEFWKYPSCVGGAIADYEAARIVANYKKWDCYDRVIRRMDVCEALAWGGWYADQTWAVGERRARQVAIDLEYESCVAKRRG